MNYKFLILAALLFGFGCAEAADALNPVDIKEWTVSYGGRSRDPFAASANSVWFVGQSGHYLARLDAASGQFTRTDLPDNPGPHNLIVGADGIVWYSGNQAGYIGRYDPKTGGIEKIPMPDARADDPHTLVMSKSGKHFWFTLQWGNFVGRLTIASRKVDLIPVTSGNARPYGITVAPDGTPWIALLGTDKLASVDPKTLKLTEHDVAPGARPRRLDATRDGRIYYSDYRRGFLGRLDPKTGKVFWTIPWKIRSGLTIPTPQMIDERHLFLTCFYNGSMLLKLKDDESKPDIVYRTEHASEKKTTHLHGIMNTPVLHDGHLYAACSYGQFRCMEALTGKRVWESLKPLAHKEPARWGTVFVTPHEDRHFLFTEQGDLVIAKLSTSGYQEIDRAHVIEPNGLDLRQRDIVWSHPAYARKCAFIRNDTEVICVSLAK